MGGWSVPEKDLWGGGWAFPVITLLTQVSDKTGRASKSMWNKLRKQHRPSTGLRSFSISYSDLSAAAVLLKASRLSRNTQREKNATGRG